MAEFPSDDKDAAIKWLRDPENHNFTGYKNIATDKPKEWEPLQQLIKKVTGMGFFMTLIKTAVSKRLDPENLAQRMTSEDHKAIAKMASKDIYESMSVPWVNESQAWVAEAVKTIVPRAAALWKKSERKKDRSRGGSVSPTRSPVESPKKETFKRLHEKEDNADRPPKKNKLGSEHPTPLLLMDRNIVVEHQQLDPKADVEHIVVAISAIIADDHIHRRHQDIRAQHLDYTKFRAILVIQDPEINFERFGYDWSTTTEPCIEETEEEFQFAIGLQAKDLEKGVLGGDSIRMTLKANGEL